MTARMPTLACLFIALLLALSGAAAEKPKPDLLLVYWSSADCKWCTYWESSRSGMEGSLKESVEFGKINYRVVKNKRLADSYAREDFPPDIVWLYERVTRGEERRPGRPSWVVYVNRKQIASFYGARDWEEKHLPEIKRLVAHFDGLAQAGQSR